MKYPFIIIFISLLNLNSYAQDSTKTFPEIIIKEKIKNANEKAVFFKNAQSIEILTATQLNRNNPAFIEQSLGALAGVQVNKRTQLGGQRLVIRGYGNDQKFNNWGIKVYINEMPLSTAEGITVMDDIDFSLVNNVEVIKGPAATLYGAGVGGVVLFNIKCEDKKGLNLGQKFTVGSFGLVQSNTRLDVSSENASLLISYGHLASSGYRPRGSSLKNFWTLYGDFKVSTKNTMSMYLSHNYSHEGVTGQISYADYYAGIDNGNAAYASKNARNDLSSNRFSISNKYQISKNIENQSSVFYFSQDLKRVAAGADENSLSPNVGIRSVFRIHYKIYENLENTANIGTEIQQSRSLISNWRFVGDDAANPLKVKDISKGSFFKYKTQQNSFFIHNTLNNIKLDLALIVGLSANQINYNRTDLLAGMGLVSGYNKNLSFQKGFKTSINPHIALQKTWNNQITNLSYSEGYNAPTASSGFISGLNLPNDALLPEKAKMWDLSFIGHLIKNKFDYKFSVFDMSIKNKLSQLSGNLPNGGTYTYFANTGLQRNKGLELSLDYILVNNKKTIIRKIEPFVNLAYYDFKYQSFNTLIDGKMQDYAGKSVVGVPTLKYTFGLDIETKAGIYLVNTYNVMGSVFTDFANSNHVKGFGLLNSKIGIIKTHKKLSWDVYLAANNITNQINYTFLFLGNNINDSDPGSGYGITDVNPGPSKKYFFGGVNFKYSF